MFDDLRVSARALKGAGFFRHMTGRGAMTLVRDAFRNRLGPWSIFRYHARNTPDRLAVIAGDRRWTFAQWNSALDGVAHGLARRGLGRGSAGLVMLKNRPEFLLAQSGLARMGGTAISGDWRAHPEEIAFLANHGDAKVIFYEAEARDAVRAAARMISGVPDENYFVLGPPAAGEHSFDTSFPYSAEEYPDDSKSSAVLMYTSGTTGVPKGAVRRFPSSAVAGVLAFMGATPMRTDDVHLQTMPMFHGTAFGFISMSHLLGATVVICDEFSPEKFLRLIAEHKVTQLSTGPKLMHRLVHELSREQQRAYDTSSLRAIFCGGTRMHVSVGQELMDRFGDILYNIYGATETSHNIVATPAQMRAHPDTIGRSVVKNDIRIVDETGVEVPTGEIGELCVKNSTQIAAYYKNEEAMKAAVKDGYFATGDMARVDADGNYFVYGRKSDVLVRKGKKVYPAMVEMAIEELSAVAEAGVVAGGRDSLVAFVVPRRGQTLTAAEVTAHLRARLDDASQLTDVHIDATPLPRNATGKIDKKALKHKLAESAGSGAVSAGATASEPALRVAPVN